MGCGGLETGSFFLMTRRDEVTEVLYICFGYLATFVLAIGKKEGRKEYHCEPKVAPRDYCFGFSLIATN